MIGSSSIISNILLPVGKVISNPLVCKAPDTISDTVSDTIHLHVNMFCTSLCVLQGVETTCNMCSLMYHNSTEAT